MTRVFLGTALISLLCTDVYAGIPPVGVTEEGGAESKPVFTIDCVGAAIECTHSGSTMTLDASGAGGGSGDVVTVNGTGADTTANFKDDVYSEWTLVDGDGGGPDDVNVKADYDQTLAGNPALEVDECILMKDTGGGGFLCEGSTANTNEQIYRFPNVDGADTDENIAIGGGAFHDGFSDFVAGEHIAEGTIDHGSIAGLADDDHSAYENELNNEAGLYAALSDVTNFLQTGDALAGDDITDASVDETELATTINFADGTLLDFASNVTSATEGIMLPAHATSCTTATAEGQVCWEEDAKKLWVGDGAAPVEIGAGGSDTNSVKEYYWPGAALLPLQISDSIPPISKDAGTNIDQLVRLFDSSDDECGTVTFKVPSDVDTGTAATLRYIWYTDTNTGNVIWDIRHDDGTAEGVDPDDGAMTAVTADADAAQGTAGQYTITTDTLAYATSNWAADDVVNAEVCRDADNGSDTLNANDAFLVGFGVEMARA